MGLFERIFGNRPKEGTYQGQYKLLDGYNPGFSSWNKGLYESELVRAAIEARAVHISKLQVEFRGAARPSLQNRLAHGPNQFQTWGQFLARLSTIRDVHNTAFITPVYDEYGVVTGIYAPLPSKCEVVQYGGKPFLRYEFSWGQKAAIELESCGIMVSHQYSNDFFGETNSAMMPTMELINIVNQGIEEGVKSAATYRFMAQLSNFSKAEDLAKERKRFTAENFAKDADGGGLLLFPNTYANIKQIEAKPWIVDSDQLKLIKDNVYEYFGVNEDVLTNKAYGDAWSAFYEGAIEPFAVQFSEVLTKMLFTLRERSQGNMVIVNANRLQYLSNGEKLTFATNMADRGVITRNELRELFNLTPLPDAIGNTIPVRGEYYNVGEDKVVAKDEGES